LPTIRPIGLQFADTTVWLAVATALAVFRVSKVVEGGVEVTPDVRYTDTVIRYARHLLLLPLSIDVPTTVIRRASNVASSLGPHEQKS